MTSQLDAIIGIGEIRRNRLLKTFGSLQRITEASDAELRGAGLDPKTIGEIRKALPGTEGGGT
jgi:excinuclease ABC subunit C